MKIALPVIDLDAQLTARVISTTPEIEALIAANAPVAIGVSGGKDSCAVAIAYVEHLRSRGHAGKIILIHSDLGRVEWEDSLPTCERLAAYLGVELVIVRRKSGDMMDRWLARWANNVARYANLECVKLILPWSTPKMRFCTSELKTAIICRYLCQRFPGQRIISVSGIRRTESPDRRKAPVTKVQNKLTSKAHQTTGIDLHAIIAWTLADVLAFLNERSFRLHEAYTEYGSSRVSCRFCIMGSKGDLLASANVPSHLPLLIEMVELEIRSTFAFQNSWLGDVAPQLLPPGMVAELEAAKIKAAQREQIESVIPKHLLYTKGWPTCIPTRAEAQMLADVRSQIASLINIPAKYTDPDSIIARYEELMAANVTKANAKKRKAA